MSIESDYVQAPKDTCWKLTPAVLIAVGAPYSYALAYGYEQGFASYFYIPGDIISVSLENTLLVAAALAGIIYVGFCFIEVLLKIVPNGLRKPAFRPAIYSLVFIIAFASIHKGNELAAFVVYAICGVGLFRDYGFPLLYWRKGMSYSDCVGRSHADDVKFDEKGVALSLLKRVSLVEWRLYLFVIVLLPYAYFVGRNLAAQQYTFSVDSADPSWVFVSRYGEDLVFAKRDQSLKRLKPEFRIQPANQAGLYLTQTKMGPFEQTVLEGNVNGKASFNVRPLVKP